MRLLSGNLIRLLLLLLGAISSVMPDELVVTLSNDLTIKGTFRGLKKDVLYLEHSDSLIIIDQSTVENLLLDGEIVEFEALGAGLSPKINFNRYAGFLEIKERTLEQQKTIELARSSCPGCNKDHVSVSTPKTIDNRKFESDLTRFPSTPFCLNSRPSYCAKWTAGLMLTFNSMSPIMATQVPPGYHESLDTEQPMGHLDLFLSYKRTSVKLGLAAKYSPLRGDSLIGWRPNGGGAIWAFSTGQPRTGEVQYKYLRISRLLTDRDLVKLVLSIQLSVPGDGLLSYRVAAFGKKNRFQYHLGLQFFSYGFLPLTGFWETSLSYHLPSNWFLLTEANWRSLGFQSNAIPHTAFLAGVGHEWDAGFQTIIFAQSLWRAGFDNCCEQIRDERLGFQLQYVLRRD